MPKKLKPSDQLKDRLQTRHGRKWKGAWKKLNQKIYNAKSSLIQRGKEHELDNTIALTDIRQKIYNAYSQECVYCHEELDVYNMGVDHIVPLEAGGTNNMRNLQIICQRCNTRKGPLKHMEYIFLLKAIQPMSTHAQKYILRKLAKGDY